MAYTRSTFATYTHANNGTTFTITAEAYRNDAGEHRIIYTATDPAGKVATVKRCASRLAATALQRLRHELDRLALEAPYADQPEAAAQVVATAAPEAAAAPQLIEVDHISNGIEHYQDNAGFMGAARGGLGGSWVVIYQAKAQGIDTQGRQFAVVCEQHGNIGRAHTLGLAYALTEQAQHFCPDCRPKATKGLPMDARAHLIEMATNDHRRQLETLDDVQLLSAAGFEVMAEPVSADEPLQATPEPSPMMAQILAAAAADDAAAELVAYDNGDTLEKADGTVIGRIAAGREPGTFWIGLHWRDESGEIVAGRPEAIKRLKELYLQAQQPAPAAAAEHEVKGFTVPLEPARPQIVVLCGSTRFRADFEAANLSETLAGRIVLMPGHFTHALSSESIFGHKEQHFGPEVAAQLDELYKRKIDLSDEVLILNVGGYIGESTRSEVAYAQAQGKVIRWLEPVATPELEPAAPSGAGRALLPPRFLASAQWQPNQ